MISLIFLSSLFSCCPAISEAAISSVFSESAVFPRSSWFHYSITVFPPLVSPITSRHDKCHFPPITLPHAAFSSRAGYAPPADRARGTTLHNFSPPRVAAHIYFQFGNSFAILDC